MNAHCTTDVNGEICSNDERAQHHWEEGKSVREVHETTPQPSILSDTEKRVDIGCGTHQSPHWQHALAQMPGLGLSIATPIRSLLPRH